MANRLTDATVKAAKAGVSKTTGRPATRDLYDASEPGLCLRVQPSGRKSWGLRVQVNGRMRRYDLGEYPLRVWRRPASCAKDEAGSWAGRRPHVCHCALLRRRRYRP